MALTASQQAAITARGNVLVVAGAGTGKTRTVVERCLHCLVAEKPRASLEEILMVTFTEAAAAEMRQRIRDRLEQERTRQPNDPHWPEQLALFETAHIGTLHSFCLEIVREHFYELELDPQLAVMPEEEARLLANETLESILKRHYAGGGGMASAVQQLIQAQAGGQDEPIRAIVRRLHDYTQTLPDAAGWFKRQLTMFAEPEPLAWREWLFQALADWPVHWLEHLSQQRDNEIATQCAAVLKAWPNPRDPQVAARVLTEIQAVAEQCPYGKKSAWVHPLKHFLAEAQFLGSLIEPTATGSESSDAQPGPRSDALAEDWSWVRAHMTTLLQLTHNFGQEFAEAKRQLGMLDFHDLEQYALKLLWKAESGEPTAVAQYWREKLRFLFVDEYQDINAAQDKIIAALSREGSAANRFLVGDVKQSIYRFRLANPRIFQAYIEQWGKGAAPDHTQPSQVIPLTDNFRSREGILEFINSVFELVMQPEVGGVAYDEQARLRFGAPEERQALAKSGQAEPVVELHLRLKHKNDSGAAGEDESIAEISELQDAAKEARLVALRLIELKNRPLEIWDENQFRPVEWRDMAVLLRSPANKAESFAKEFARLQVPLEVARGGFYESLEILDLLSLLAVLDNPLQDLPLLAVLHSPLVGLNLNELAAVRLALPKGHFWLALVRWHENAAAAAPLESQPNVELRRKVSVFQERFARWRRLTRELPLSRCLETILAETHYANWLLTQPRGEQRRANVQRLLGLAQDFDQFQRQGLFRFLRFIEAQQLAETEPEVAAVGEENAVRLMSIHQSKGLEFPVVVVADLGKRFNFADLRAEIILDELWGLCPQIKPPQASVTYPSLPYWLARRQQERELLGEEVRLLYVAMTRARDRLVLSASLPEARFEGVWQNPAEPGAALGNVRCAADWLGFWFSRQRGASEAMDQDSRASSQTAPDSAGTPAAGGRIGCLRWFIHDGADLKTEQATAPQPAAARADPLLSAEAWQVLERRLAWRYPFTSATNLPAKSSVSQLRRHIALEAEEAGVLLKLPQQNGRPHDSAMQDSRNARGTGTAVETGTAHHRFLQLVALDQTGNLAALKAEAERLQKAGALSAAEVELIDFPALAQFWNSDLGRRVRAETSSVRRELEFTARFAVHELAGLVAKIGTELPKEYVVVQGIADLVVLRPGEIWLLDFKTDALAPDEVEDRAKAYQSQVMLYAKALSRIYKRPVTEAWLYFLAAHTAVQLALQPCSVARQ